MCGKTGESLRREGKGETGRQKEKSLRRQSLRGEKSLRGKKPLRREEIAASALSIVVALSRDDDLFQLAIDQRSKP
ncbi:MAG: hypothetical protein WBO23_16235 [Burkholderiales bacterium]